jgi:copper transport protein
LPCPDPASALRSRPGRSALSVAAALLLACVAPATAWGHAAFVESTPAAGARVETGPAEITLAYTEPLDRELTEARLIDARSGAEIPVVTRSERERELTLQPQRRLDRAPYRVEWHTVSTVDGHALEGSFGFGVRTAAVAVEQDLEQSPLAREGWIRIAARAVFYAALFFFAGGVLLTALLSRRDPGGWLAPPSLEPALRAAGPERQVVAERAWRRTLDAGRLALAAAVVVALAEAADASGGIALDGVSQFLFSNGAGLARAGTVVAVAMAVLLATRLPLAAAAWLALAFLAIAYGGHASSASERGLALVTDWIHLVAGAIWVGGIAQVAATWVPLALRGRRELGIAAARSVLPRFGRLALPAFLVVASTGLANALIQLGRPEALFETGYGRVLAVKIGLVALIALASYGHAFRLRPALVAANPHPPPGAARRHWRLLGSEPWLGLAAVAAAGTLVAFPLPPQQLGEAGEAEAAAPCDPCPLAQARDDQLAVAESLGTRIAAVWIRRDAEHLHGRLELLDTDGAPTDAPVSIAGAELTDCGEGCRRFESPLAAELTVSAEEEGESYTATLPATWDAGRSEEARRLLARAQAGMRALDSLRLDETTTSGVGPGVEVRYRFAAPDRMAYVTDGGARVVAIGRTGYSRAPGGRWDREPFGADGFQVARMFRWTPYARSVRWLGGHREGGRSLVEVALFDPATPFWFRLTIDRRRGLVLDERMIATAHFMDRRYHSFERPVKIRAPR